MFDRRTVEIAMKWGAKTDYNLLSLLTSKKHNS